MPKNNVEINIRPDLKDITNTVLHLYEVGRYFGKKNNEFGTLWYGNDSDIQKYLSRMDDWELYHIIEEFYRIGKDVSFSLSMQLPFINDSIRYPVVTKYVNDTKTCIISFKDEIDELLEKSKTIFLRNEDNLKHWKIERFVEIHKEIISVLSSLNNEMDSIKNSERYKIENNLLVKKDKLNKDFISEGFIMEEIELNSGKKRTGIAAIKPDKDTIIEENIFIIHGSDEAKWRELKGILINEFNLNPIVLSEEPGAGLTIIEKFEKYARTCSCAMAIFTPDDEVEKNGEKYLQARPNAVYEVGWFCGRLGRDKMILLLKEGTTIFSDFGGIIQQRFTKNISEKTIEIKKDLIQMAILEK